VVGRGGLEVTLESWADATTFTVRARREGVDVGMATGVLAENVTLTGMNVVADARHQGIGSMILDEIELLAARRGAPVPTAVAADGSWFAARGWAVRSP
jgi:GNAT superfamily N-acetyltransferase